MPRKRRNDRPPEVDVEKPPHPVYLPHFYALTQAPDNILRPTRTGAYDDLVFKRRKLNSRGKQVETSGLGSPWEDDNNIEKPPRPETFFEDVNRFNPQQPGGSDIDREHDPDEQNNMSGKGEQVRQCTMAGLPTEIRDMIFQHLLKSPREIQVFRQWTLVYSRQRLKLHTSLLRVCRAWKQQGLRILYGENTFCYKIRDPNDSKKGTEIVYRRVYGKNIVPFARYRHLMRHVKIQIEVHRMYDAEIRLAFERAIASLLKRDDSTLRDLHMGHKIEGTAPRLSTLTIELPAWTVSEIHYALPLVFVIGPDNHVPAHDFLRFTRIIPLLQALKVRSIRVLAQTGNRGCFRGIIHRNSDLKLKDLGNYFEGKGTSSEGHYWVGNMALHAGRKRERASLETLPYKLQLLALPPQDQGDRNPVIYRQGFWEPFTEECYEESLQALSENRTPSVADTFLDFGLSSSDGASDSDDDPSSPPRQPTQKSRARSKNKKKPFIPDPSPSSTERSSGSSRSGSSTASDTECLDSAQLLNTSPSSLGPPKKPSPPGLIEEVHIDNDENYNNNDYNDNDNSLATGHVPGQIPLLNNDTVPITTTSPTGPNQNNKVGKTTNNQKEIPIDVRNPFLPDSPPPGEADNGDMGSAPGSSDLDFPDDNNNYTNVPYSMIQQLGAQVEGDPKEMSSQRTSEWVSSQREDDGARMADNEDENEDEAKVESEGDNIENVVENIVENMVENVGEEEDMNGC